MAAFLQRYYFMTGDRTDLALTAPLTVYWQPGCSSCLRAREFLRDHGIRYRSVNVLEDDSAAAALARLGARSIPVVSRGEDFVFAQDIDVLAEFVGIRLERQVLPADELLSRIDHLLAAAQRYLVQMPDPLLTTTLPGRDRSYLDLAYHVFVIPLAFLDAARGEELTYAHFERRPPATIHNTAHLVDFGQAVREQLRSWRRGLEPGCMPDKLLTYYGAHSCHSVLERTAWHTAQHVRQLMALITGQGLAPDGPLGENELAGLPLPENVYDDDVLPGPGA